MMSRDPFQPQLFRDFVIPSAMQIDQLKVSLENKLFSAPSNKTRGLCSHIVTVF